VCLIITLLEEYVSVKLWNEFESRKVIISIVTPINRHAVKTDTNIPIIGDIFSIFQAIDPSLWFDVKIDEH